ncbi:MAG: hypothetical protein ACE5G3_12190, partial [Gammaproteobacteria bacterium]
QYVTYDEARRPKMISCKVKSADHLVAEYGEGAAGPQGTCRDISERIVEMLIERLEIEDPSLANVARAQVVVEPDEPFVTGASWLSEFPLTFRGDDGRLHVNTQSLQVDWEDWRWYILPDRFRGQTYCHLIAPEHLEALLRSDGG